AGILAVWQAFTQVCRGEWETGRIALEQILTTPDLSHFRRNPATAALIRVYSRQGNFARAGELVATYKPSPGPLTRQAVMFCPVIEYAWLSGDEARFAAMIAEYYPKLEAAQADAYAGELAYWQWQAGEPVVNHDWLARPYQLQIAGNWREAADCWLDLGYPYEAARALSHGDQAAKLQALTSLEELGAQPLVDKLRAELRGEGLKQLPRGRRASTLENPFGLTNRQVQILALLTESLSNTEIASRLHLSAKTVGHHVSAILGTLQVASREEAAELARRHPDF
ncbi:MAG: response regulator transcription factor, partial [Anaerolineales bacterium]|nr:response regulator transcription factor [Anaerolineales bacterium]